MESHVTTIAELLKPAVQYVIPQFQRAYAWRREEHWEPLWDDIESVAQNMASAPNRDSVPPHFMGRSSCSRGGRRPKAPTATLLWMGNNA